MSAGVLPGSSLARPGSASPESPTASNLSTCLPAVRVDGPVTALPNSTLKVASAVGSAALSPATVSWPTMPLAKCGVISASPSTGRKQIMA